MIEWKRSPDIRPACVSFGVVGCTCSIHPQQLVRIVREDS